MRRGWRRLSSTRESYGRSRGPDVGDAFRVALEGRRLGSHGFWAEQKRETDLLPSLRRRLPERWNWEPLRGAEQHRRASCGPKERVDAIVAREFRTLRSHGLWQRNNHASFAQTGVFSRQKGAKAGPRLRRMETRRGTPVENKITEDRSIRRRRSATRVPERWYRVTLRLALHRESHRAFGLLPSFRVAGYGRRLTSYRFFARKKVQT